MIRLIKSIDELPKGPVPGIATLAALAFLVGAAVLGVAHCGHPVPTPAPTIRPAPWETSARPALIATTSAQAIATQSIRITIRRRRAPQVRHAPAGPAGDAASRRPPEQPTPADATQDTPEEETIEVEASQAIEATATASAQASASASPPPDHTIDGGHQPGYKLYPPSNEHGRIGVIAGLMPGVLAADLELVKVDVPHGLVGVPFEVGVDLEANHLQAGAAVTVGAKAFGMAGAFTTWRGDQRGLLLGAGLRF
jgi:hypothetical protein